jgi:cytochrome b
MGYALLALLMFRVVWGFVGGRWSRFRSFLYSPTAVIDYLRGRPHPDHLVGHNPLGAGSVFLMLAVLLAQIGTGLVGDDEISFTGPLNRFVESSTGLLATSYHKGIGQWLILGLIVLHISAVWYYQLRKKTDLVGPMFRGDKLLARPVGGSKDSLGTRLAALGLFALCALVVAGIVRLGG